MSDTGLVQILEGALLAAGKPLTVAQLADLFEEHEQPEKAAIREALQLVGERCEDRGFELVEVASGFRFQVRQNLSTWVARLWTERPQRYSRALLETLALIAYRQPITRGEIEEIRGVAVSSNIIKTLHEREWIRVVGHRDVPGRPAMYATTKQFLDYFNLKNLDQLPSLAEIRDLDTLNAELGFGEPLPEGSENPKVAGPELTVVGGTEHMTLEEQPGAAAGEQGEATDQTAGSDGEGTAAMNLEAAASDLESRARGPIAAQDSQDVDRRLAEDNPHDPVAQSQSPAPEQSAAGERPAEANVGDANAGKTESAASYGATAELQSPADPEQRDHRGGDTAAESDDAADEDAGRSATTDPQS